MTSDPFGVPDASNLPPAPTFDDTPAKKKRKKWPWIVGGTVVAILAILVVVGLVFGRKGSDNPRDAVSKFWTQMQAHDLKKAQDYVCSSKHIKSDKTFAAFANSVTSFTIGAETGSGSKLVYPVTVTLKEDSGNISGVINTTATKDAGDWYVCDIAPQG